MEGAGIGGGCWVEVRVVYCAMFTNTVPDLACLGLLLDDMLEYCANVHAISCSMVTNTVPDSARLVLLLDDILGYYPPEREPKTGD